MTPTTHFEKPGANSRNQRTLLFRGPLLASLVALSAFAAGCDDETITSGNTLKPQPDAGTAQHADGATDPDDESDGDVGFGGDAGDLGSESDAGDLGSDPDAGDLGSDPDAGDLGSDPDAGDLGSDPDAGGGLIGITLGGLMVDTRPGDQELDLFGIAGHKFWIQVSDEQLAKMNAGQGGGWDPGYGDIYTPGSASSGATFAEHILVQDAKTGSVADYGKVEVKLVGESTYRQWNTTSIPNIRIDTDEFQEKMRIGSFEHIRLNNSLVGSIFRESLAHTIYSSLGYPALRSSYVFFGSNVWGENVWVPMTLMEVYKKRFCNDNAEILGGKCVNMWEFAGDIQQGGGGGPWFGEDLAAPPDMGGEGPAPLPERDYDDSWCQLSSCENSRLSQFADKLDQTPRGAGFKDELTNFVDWDKFHQYQCLNWIMWVGDDPLHNSNNNLIIEREDGKFVWEPYSVDISAGQEWYQNTPLTATSNGVALGCQADPECWEDTIATCEKLIRDFDALNPDHMVDAVVEKLTDLDMMRNGDEERAQQLRQWFVDRQANLAAELETYRYLPDGDGNCPNDLEACNDGSCGTQEQCVERLCARGAVWCESKDRCTMQEWGEECPSCAPETPYWCEANYPGECVESMDSCVYECDMGWVYCKAWGYCAPEFECPGDDVEADGGMAEPGPMPGPVPGPMPRPL